MIKTKKDLQYYIVCDLKSLDCYPINIKMRVSAAFVPSIWKFQVLLRECEYLCNKKTGVIGRFVSKMKVLRLMRYGLRLGFSIPVNCCGPGLCLCHAGTIVINNHAKIGSNARIHAGVNIGGYSKFDDSFDEKVAPIIGDNVYIGPGAKIYGGISIGNNVAIGANAVVNKTIPDNVSVAGIPAHQINERGSRDLIRYGDVSKKPIIGD